MSALDAETALTERLIALQRELHQERHRCSQLAGQSYALLLQLARCRKIMEVNDPNNALMIFGKPEVCDDEA